MIITSRISLSFFSCTWLILLLAITSKTATMVDAKTALIFGASGTVGSEVLQGLLHQSVIEKPNCDTANADVNANNDGLLSSSLVPFWKKIIIVGRRNLDIQLPADLSPQQKEQINLTQIIVPDLSSNTLDQNDQIQKLREEQIDACFITIGAGQPYNLSLRQWYAIDLELPVAITRLCANMKVPYLALMTSVDAQDDPKPFTEEELPLDKATDNDKNLPLGWWGMLSNNARMKGLVQVAVTSSASSIPYVRIFQPSNIKTDQSRYGWADWTLFKLLPFIDPLLPSPYKSIYFRLLGKAIATDAVQILLNDDGGSSRSTSATTSNVTYLKHADFNQILDAAKSKTKEDNVANEL